MTMVQRSLDAHRALGHADGHRARRALLRARRVAAGDDHREGRPDLRVAARTGSCTSSRSRSTTQMRERDKDFYDRLEKAGFDARLGRRRLRPVHEVPAPRLGLLHRRRRRPTWSPTASIKLEHGPGRPPRPRTRWCCADGTELPADLVVYATGYGSMNGWAADLICQEVADKVGKVWGLGSDTTKDPGPWEGEQRNMWKPTQQESALVPRRQPAPVAALLAVPRAAAQGALRGHRHAGLRPAGGASFELMPAPLLLGLPPIIDDGARVLILGNMPSVISLAAQQYYANPRNGFWRITGEIFGFDAGAPYEIRAAALVAHGVAVWDVLRGCRGKAAWTLPSSRQAWWPTTSDRCSTRTRRSSGCASTGRPPRRTSRSWCLRSIGRFSFSGCLRPVPLKPCPTRRNWRPGG